MCDLVMSLSTRSFSLSLSLSLSLSFSLSLVNNVGCYCVSMPIPFLIGSDNSVALAQLSTTIAVNLSRDCRMSLSIESFSFNTRTFSSVRYAEDHIL